MAYAEHKQAISLHVVQATNEMLDEWCDLRCALWPHRRPEHHRDEVRRILRHPDRNFACLALLDGAAIGFAEAALRGDYVNGCSSSPVAFLEGIFVLPSWQRHGAGRQLCSIVEAWAIKAGCKEFASDTALTNEVAQSAHQALGFEETERVVFYRKSLRDHR